MRPILSNLRESWRALVLADLLFNAIAFVLLFPTISLMFRGFVTLSGRTILADADIAKFFLHPIGLLTLLVVGGAVLSVVMLKQAVLMTITTAQERRQRFGVLASVMFVFGKSRGVFRIAVTLILRITLYALPFLLAGGAIYFFLLTDYDINYYLKEKPPIYWIACVLIGACVLGMIFACTRSVLRWLLALPIFLFENTHATTALKESETSLRGHERTLAGYVFAWMGINLAFAWSANGLIVYAARWLVPDSPHSLIALATAIGFVLLCLFVANLAAGSVAAISFALLLTRAFALWREQADVDSPPPDGSEMVSLGLTKTRLAYGLLIAFVLAFVIGLTTIHSIEIKDNIEVIAHRGASVRAPENSLASAIAAIEDGADWVEIDVQESSDGVVVVTHDSDLKRLGGGPEKIWEMKANELQLADIGSHFSSDFSDQHVPTLDQLLKTCRGKIRVLIELKYYGHDEDLERRVIQIVEDNDMVSQVAIMSLEADKVKKFKQIRPDWTTGLLTAVAIGGLQKAEADFLAVNSNLATQSFIQAAHGAGKKVSVWTVNDRPTISLMISRGVDSLITDNPALARSVLRERATMSPVERLLIALGEQSGIVTARSMDQ